MASPSQIWPVLKIRAGLVKKLQGTWQRRSQSHCFHQKDESFRMVKAVLLHKNSSSAPFVHACNIITYVEKR